MDDETRQALTRDRTIDITTTGRTSGRPHRIEMAFQNLDGVIYIAGTPGKRDWYANLLANPAFTFHLKAERGGGFGRTRHADHRARHAPGDPRAHPRQTWSLGRPGAWMTDSPLVHVTFDSD